MKTRQTIVLGLALVIGNWTAGGALAHEPGKDANAPKAPHVAHESSSDKAPAPAKKAPKAPHADHPAAPSKAPAPAPQADQQAPKAPHVAHEPSPSKSAHSSEPHGGGDHAHTAPHGGLVQTVGKYHFELVVKDDEINVYLLDGSENTLPVDGKEAKAILQIPARAKQELPLSVSGPFLRAAVDLKQVQALVAIVSIKLDGTSQNARFSWKRAGQHAEYKK